MKPGKELYKEGPAEFSVSKVVQGNLLMAIWMPVHSFFNYTEFFSRFFLHVNRVPAQL